MPKPQSAQSHAALDPLYHYVLAPLSFINLGLAIYELIHGWPWDKHLHVAWIIVAVILILVIVRLRTYPLKIQDRIIRLEERHRIAALVPLAPLDKLSVSQLIALRFASDAELPALVSRTLKEGLDAKAIKQAIVTWRPDYDRI